MIVAQLMMGLQMAHKIQQITNQIRQDIVGGGYAPGVKLPSQIDLSERFSVAGMTIRTVLKKLEKEGFIESRNRSGTYVSASPPHLCQYGLVFWIDPKDPNEINWSRYFQALALAAERFEKRTGRTVVQFHGVNWHTDSLDRKRLIRYMESQRLAGVVFSTSPFLLEHSPILDLPGFPRVALQARSKYPDVYSVVLDRLTWIEMAVSWLVAQGRRRIAVFQNGGDDGSAEGNYTTLFRREFEKHGLETRERWFQCFSIKLPSAVVTVAELLMHDRERPDALIVMDDNYVAPALEGLRTAGVDLTRDVTVVGHANFPLPPVDTPEVRLLGYDIEDTLDQCFSTIDTLRQGKSMPLHVGVHPVWDDERNQG